MVVGRNEIGTVRSIGNGSVMGFRSKLLDGARATLRGRKHAFYDRRLGMDGLGNHGVDYGNQYGDQLLSLVL